MPQFFNLNGTPIQYIPELRVNVIKDQSANLMILQVDTANNAVDLYNVESIYTVNGREITANNIKFILPSPGLSKIHIWRPTLVGRGKCGHFATNYSICKARIAFHSGQPILTRSCCGNYGRLLLLF